MVLPTTPIDSRAIRETACPVPDAMLISNSTTIDEIDLIWNEQRSVRDVDERFDWPQELQGVILGAYFWVYGICHIPGAILTQKFGGKFTLLIAVMIPALLSMLTPAVVALGEY